MKRLLLLCIVAVLMCGTSYGWGGLAHATVAKIAENHLTPKAKRLLDKYLDGKSIVYYASYADAYKSDLLMELDFEPSNAKRKVTFPHSFDVNDDCTVFNGMRKGDKFVKNCVYLADQYAADLKANHRTMNDSLRMLSIAMLVHWVGDMHCPAHIRYPEDQTACNFKIYYGGKKMGYHGLWDRVLFGRKFPWSFSDCALVIDSCSKREIKEITAGNLFDWGKESAIVSRPIHKYREGAVIDNREYSKKYGELAEHQVRNAGYRLAKLLNDIFK